jgi:hypothetical protein
MGHIFQGDGGRFGRISRMACIFRIAVFAGFRGKTSFASRPEGCG